ncbi:hypothetical protein [Streptomyces sp. NBC_01465]|uniref:hypothetical protein n=1 Tax=Streptomyces sp. NBC_01465 TaxID=2903878 RepID=UPI002E303649|nr:hypothetical protein [Streptomyces sp. NBC_01465]
MPAAARAWASDLTRLWSGRALVLLVERLGATTDALLKEATAVGARVLGVVAAHGTGAGGAVPVFRVLGGADFDRVAYARALASPSPQLREWFDHVDPDNRALVLGTNQTESITVCGRPVHGRRLPAWAVWEDKTLIHHLWEEAGVATAPSHVTSLDGERIRARAQDVDTGAGVVLAMDSSTGHRGDSHGLAWLHHAEQIAPTLHTWQGLTHKVRVAPFMPGVPYSVLGMVTASGVAVFDPMEIVTLRSDKDRRFLFCGSSTAWRPARDVVDSIRGQARRVGSVLAGRNGYRGMFSVDGISTADGCFPTEVNPRQASGLGLRAAWPDFPLYLFNRAVQSQAPAFESLDPATVEHLVRQATGTCPSLSVRLRLPTGAATSRRGGVRTYHFAGTTHWAEWDAADDVLTLRAVGGDAGTDATAGPLLARLGRTFGLDLHSHDTRPVLERSSLLRRNMR